MRGVLIWRWAMVLFGVVILAHAVIVGLLYRLSILETVLCAVCTGGSFVFLVLMGWYLVRWVQPDFNLPPLPKNSGWICLASVFLVAASGWYLLITANF